MLLSVRSAWSRPRAGVPAPSEAVSLREQPQRGPRLGSCQVSAVLYDPGVTRRAALYCRISKDREGAGLGVDRQERDCRALAARLGWDIVAVHTDNDLSAYSGKRRPGYEALLDDLRSGHADAVITWHLDRLHRSPVELEDYIAACSDGGRDIPTHCVMRSSTRPNRGGNHA